MCFIVSCQSSLVTTTLDADSFEKNVNQITEPQLVDVRTLAEYSEEHLPGAILMDVKDTAFYLQITQLDKERPVFVYCRSGKRSLDAAAILEQNKFKVVYNLKGGIIEWKEKGKDVSNHYK